MPKAQSDSIAEATRKNGVPVEYLVLPDKGHGFSKKENEAEVASCFRAFLDQHLKTQDKAAAN